MLYVFFVFGCVYVCMLGTYEGTVLHDYRHRLSPFFVLPFQESVCIQDERVPFCFCELLITGQKGSHWMMRSNELINRKYA